MCNTIAVALLLINPLQVANTSNHDVPPPPYLYANAILSPHSPFYHHCCFLSLRCLREEDLSRSQTTRANGAPTQNIIINATATAMHDKDPFQSYAPTMRGQQYSDQQEPPPLRLSSTSYIVLRLHRVYDLHLRSTLVHRYSTQNILLMQRPSQLILPSSVSWFVVLSSSP